MMSHDPHLSLLLWLLAGVITFSVAYYKAYGGSAPVKKDGKKA